MINRRQFLIASAALLSQACVSKVPLVGSSGGRGKLKPPFTPRGVVYLIPTPHSYFKTDQDMKDKIKYDLVLEAPSGYESKSTSTITVMPESGTNVKRARVPVTVHAIGKHNAHNLIYLVSVDHPSSLFVLDPNTFELVSWAALPKENDKTIFSGHVVEIPGTDFIAVGLNGLEMGKHDFVSVRHARTLKEVERYSTKGFELHEVTLSPDGSLFGCGHYGSLLGSGPYKEYGLGWWPYYLNKPTGFTYPAFVSLVNAKNGNLEAIYRDPTGGQHGHTVIAPDNQAYIPQLPPWMKKEDPAHPRFQEGVQKEPIWGDNFGGNSTGLGVHVVFDSKFNDVLCPSRYRQELVTANVTSKKIEHFKLETFSDQRYPHSLELHPDGKHYVVTTNQGVLAFQRGTHKLVPELSFNNVFMGTHSHFTTYSS